MSLDRNKCDRDYLIGRLMAVKHMMQCDSPIFEKYGTVPTSVERHWRNFQLHPQKFLEIIDKELVPYVKRLDSKLKSFYEDELEEINELLELYDIPVKERLNELFILGYYHERKYLSENVQNQSKKRDLRKY